MTREVRVSHPEKVLFDEDGLTKGDLVEYYRAVAGAMLPLVEGRPLAMERYPNGIDAQGFFQQQAPKYAPDWIERVTVPHAERGQTTHLVLGHAEDLIWLANQNTVTLHLWPSRIDAVADDPIAGLDRPDLLVFDLDPAPADSPEEQFAQVRLAATRLRELLDELGLPAWVKTTGSRGLHLVVPLDREATTAEADAFALDVGRVVAAREPERLTTEWLVEDRDGKLLVDTARNRWAQLIAAPYTVRAKPGAPVSTPLAWEELDEQGFSPRRYTLRTVPERLAGGTDPWSDLRTRLGERGASLRAARERLAEVAPDLVPTDPGDRPTRFGRRDRRPGKAKAAGADGASD
jgi:bifunctional non-homologous end joining protein LigD